MMQRSRGGLFRWLDQWAVEKLLGVPLPARAANLRFVRWQPSTDLAYYEACIKFRATHEAYHDLARRRNLVLYRDSGPTAHLPTLWRQPDTFEQLAWWDPSPETPPDAASGTVGAYGWILAKWERGHVYIRISATGHATGTPP